MKVQANVIEKILNDVEVGKKVNNFLDGKKSRENIPLDEATAFLIYLGLTEDTYGYIKKFTDDRNLPFLPNFNYVRKERKECVAEDLTVTDTEAVASVKATSHNYLKRLLQDEDVAEKVEQVEKEHGEEIEEWQLVEKLGWDGSTQKRAQVGFEYIFLK